MRDEGKMSGPASAPSAVRRKLLLVDDDETIGALIGRVARSCGLDTTVTSSARDFRNAFVALAPDIVVVDIFMPEMDGIELVQWIMDRRLDLHIVFVSGNDRVFAESAVLLAEEKGVERVDFLSKPVSIVELAEVLSLDSSAAPSGVE